jgi:hypothetical protein
MPRDSCKPCMGEGLSAQMTPAPSDREEEAADDEKASEGGTPICPASSSQYGMMAVPAQYPRSLDRFNRKRTGRPAVEFATRYNA